MTGRVQNCGCIAVPEELQAMTGLYPGATFAIEPAPDGKGLLLRTLQGALPAEPSLVVACGAPGEIR